jgi:hypothetical protein
MSEPETQAPDIAVASSESLPPGNPYFTALVTITSILGSIAVILYILGITPSYNGSQQSVLASANGFATYAGIAFLSTMILGGVKWQLSKLKD